MNRTGCAGLLTALLAVVFPLQAQTTTGPALGYTLRDRGGTAVETTGTVNTLLTGYARVQPNIGNTTPSGFVILSSRSNGVLVNETGAIGSTAVLSGRTYAEVNGLARTALAFANPNSFDVTVMFSVVNSAGVSIRQASFTVAANGQAAAFLNEEPFRTAGPFVGTFSFDASGPVGVVAMRSVVNESGELLMASQPVAALITAPVGVVVLAHFADGGGWKTRILMVNTTDSVITGSVQFFSEGTALATAAPLILNVNGSTANTFDYTIAPRSSAQMETAGASANAQVGSVRITPAGASASPSAFAEFLMTIGGVTQVLASASATPPAVAARVFVESADDFGEPLSIQSAIAVANNSSTNATVNLELLDLAGGSTGFSTILSVPGFGHASKFLKELFPSAPTTIRGVLRITAGTTPLSIVAVRARFNEVGRFLATSIPVSNEGAPATTSELLFPEIADGGGYTTQFALFSGIAGQSSSGTLRFLNRSGQQLSLTVR